MQPFIFINALPFTTGYREVMRVMPSKRDFPKHTLVAMKSHGTRYSSARVRHRGTGHVLWQQQDKQVSHLAAQSATCTYKLY